MVIVDARGWVNNPRVPVSRMTSLMSRTAAGLTTGLHRRRARDRTTFGTLLSRGGVPLRTAQAAMRHSTPVLTANTYTDPKLLDVAGALDALPSLPLDQSPGDTSERARAVATGTYGDGAVALAVALPGDKPSKTMVSTDKTEAEPPNSLGIARLDVSSGNVSGRETMTSPVQASSEWRRAGSNRQPPGCKPGVRTARKVFPHNG